MTIFLMTHPNGQTQPNPIKVGKSNSTQLGLIGLG